MDDTPSDTPILPGNLTSPVAGPILRRGAPVVSPLGYKSSPGPWIPVEPGSRGVIFGEAGDRLIVGFVEGVRRFPGDESIGAACPAPASILALDLSDDLGRDIAVRWGIRHETAVHAANEALAYSECSPETLKVLAETRSRMLAADRRDIAARWHALRDDAAALASACLTMVSP